MASPGEDHGSQQGPSSGAPSTYHVRPLQPVDLDGISRVQWRACRTAYRFMSWSYTEDEVRRWCAGKLEEWDWGQVVCAKDLIVAYLAASGAHIDQLFVDLDHQRAGLGSALLTAMRSGDCARRRCTCLLRISLPVRSMNGSGSDRWTPGGMRRTGRLTSCYAPSCGPGAAGPAHETLRRMSALPTLLARRPLLLLGRSNGVRKARPFPSVAVEFKPIGIS